MATQESKVTTLPEEIADDEQEASVEAEVDMAGTKEAKEVVNEENTEQGSNEDMNVEEAPATEPKTPAVKASASRKKEKSAPKGPDLSAVELNLKRQQDAANQIDAAIAANRQQIQELESKELLLTSEAQAQRKAAEKVAQEYISKKCEVAIAKMEGDVPKKPLPAYIRFCMDTTLPGVSAALQSKKRAEMWTNLAEAEKKKYNDRYEAEMKKFREWGASEEGQKNHRERTELIRQIKATGEEELAKALYSNLDTSSASPGKRPAKTSQDTPVKHRRVTPAEPALDDKVLEEAGKADLLAQLKNLATRPEVVALSKSWQELWDALKAHSGMVNAAKRSLVGA